MTKKLAPIDMPTTERKVFERLQTESLYQVAAYIGYRPWSEFCAMKDASASAPPASHALVAAATDAVAMLNEDGEVECGMIDGPFRMKEWRKRLEALRAALEAERRKL